MDKRSDNNSPGTSFKSKKSFGASNTLEFKQQSPISIKLINASSPNRVNKGKNEDGLDDVVESLPVMEDIKEKSEEISSASLSRDDTSSFVELSTKRKNEVKKDKSKKETPSRKSDVVVRNSNRKSKESCKNTVNKIDPVTGLEIFESQKEVISTFSSSSELQDSDIE